MSELRLERRFAAAPETVFDFVTRAEHLAKWWGPEGMTLPEAQLDLTKPGPWLSVMMNADGKRFKVTGEVVAVEPPHRVELTWAWHDENDERGRESSVRFEVKPDGAGGTRFTLVHSGLADEEAASNHEMGWTSSLRKLERLAD
ncbi:MAG: SRPBCC domain-containing protein [Pseudomonadota bacterium]|nr:SRPBCC domain-containing protein [Pseudomonadota bacterium]